LNCGAEKAGGQVNRSWEEWRFITYSQDVKKYPTYNKNKERLTELVASCRETTV